MSQTAVLETRLEYKPALYTIPEIKFGERLSLENTEVRVQTHNPFPKDKIIVGLMSSAAGEVDAQGHEFKETQYDMDIGRLVGKVVAQKDCIMSDGACLGAPFYAIEGAKEHDGYTLGMSPFLNDQSHKTAKHHDMIVYFGAGLPDRNFDFLFRDVLNTHYAHVVFARDGRWGTNDEIGHVIEAGGKLVAIDERQLYRDLGKEPSGATTAFLNTWEQKLIKKDTGAAVIPVEPVYEIVDGEVIIDIDQTEARLAKALETCLEHERAEWKRDGRINNRFYNTIVSKLEEVMLASR